MDFQVFDAFRRCFYPDRGSLVTVPVLLFGRMTRHRNGMLFLWRLSPEGDPATERRRLGDGPSAPTAGKLICVNTRNLRGPRPVSRRTLGSFWKTSSGSPPRLATQSAGLSFAAASLAARPVRRRSRR
jgi:hypothetical protein